MIQRVLQNNSQGDFLGRLEGGKKMAERVGNELPTPLRPFYAQKPRLKKHDRLLVLIINPRKSQKKPMVASQAAP